VCHVTPLRNPGFLSNYVEQEQMFREMNKNRSETPSRSTRWRDSQTVGIKTETPLVR
jgi:hypothetical protein